jgi:hypothetical protein
MTRIIYVVYTKEYLTSRQIIGANLKKYAFLCDYSEVKIDDLIDSPMYSTPMQVVSISPCCEDTTDITVGGIPIKQLQGLEYNYQEEEKLILKRHLIGG